MVGWPQHVGSCSRTGNLGWRRVPDNYLLDAAGAVATAIDRRPGHEVRSHRKVSGKGIPGHGDGAAIVADLREPKVHPGGRTTVIDRYNQISRAGDSRRRRV